MYDDKPIITKSRAIGPFKTDFTLDLSGGSKLLVELQINRDEIVLNGKPTPEFTEAVEQVEEWFKWIEDNDKENLPFYSGLIIIGRSKYYELNKKIIDGIISAIKHPVSLKKYDDLLNSIDKIIKTLRDPSKVSV